MKNCLERYREIIRNENMLKISNFRVENKLTGKLRMGRKREVSFVMVEKNVL
jgi:hypothetical protein